MEWLNVRRGGQEWRWLLLIVLGGMALRFAAILLFPHAPESDELAYRSMALSMVNGHGVVDDNGNHAFYNAGYPAFILAPVFYFFGENLMMVRLVHMLLGGITIAMCYLVAAQAGAGMWGRLVAAALWAVYLPSSVYGVYLAKENLMIPLMLGVIWCVLRLIAAPQLRYALGAGALLGILALTGNAALALGGGVLFGFAVMPVTVKQKVQYVLAMGLAAAVIAGPWMARNQAVLGAPVLNTNGGFNLYLGNNPNANGWFVSIGDTPRGDSWNAMRLQGEVYATETLKKEAIAWIKANPESFVTLSLKKLMYFWMPPVHEGQRTVSSMEKMLRLAWAVQFSLMVLAALGTALVASLRNKRLLVFWLALAGYTAVHMLFYVIFRYREPVMPLVAVMAALTIEACLARWRAPAIRQAGRA